MNSILAAGCAAALAATLTARWSQEVATDRAPAPDPTMQLGNFSVSLTVKDLRASQAFYERLDFRVVGGDVEQNWLILQNGTTTIGLFQGMFERNILTFNPGWTHEQETLESFQDVRELQRTLEARGLQLQTRADESTDGPASFVLVDPDGNPLLFDQHVPKPKG
jgi:catechol 2,3-dioxygenase-like lactoylglutathione lyase family enzyme